MSKDITNRRRLTCDNCDTFRGQLITEAKKQGCIIISMKNDWKRIFAFG